jgi:hypothetical protein
MIRIFAHHCVRGAALALLAAIAAPLAAQGAPAPMTAAAADHPAYGEVFDAMAAAVDNEKVLDNGLATMRQQLAATPVLAQAEAKSPGLIEEIVAGIRPIMRRHGERVAAQYRPQMTAALAEHLTPEEAVRVAAFYRSDLGRRLMGTVTDNYNLDQTLTNAMAQKQLTEADVSADIAAAVGAGLKDMDPKDILEMARQFMSDPAMAKLQRANPAILAIRARMENEPLTKADETEMGNVIAAVFARRSGK